MIERAPFGATGHDSSRVIFGAERFERRPSDDEMAGLAAHAESEPLFV